MIALLCITSTLFISGGAEVRDRLDSVGNGAVVPQQQQQLPTTNTPAALPPGGAGDTSQ